MEVYWFFLSVAIGKYYKFIKKKKNKKKEEEEEERHYHFKYSWRYNDNKVEIYWFFDK